MPRMLWPRILYWFSLGLTSLGILCAAFGNIGAESLEVGSETQSGGALFAALGVAGLVAGKAWMDYVVRRRQNLACPSCGVHNHFNAVYCNSCGFMLRNTKWTGSPESRT